MKGFTKAQRVFGEGGKGSGFFGHFGRKGKVGGSAASGATRTSKRKRVPNSKIDNLKDAETAIRNRKRGEELYLFGPDGERLLYKKSSSSHVPHTEADLKLFKGATMTHNHPSGGPPSQMDIIIGLRHGLKETRSVSPTHTFSVKYPAKINYDVDSFTVAFDRASDKLRSEFKSAIKAGRMTPAEARSRHHSELWSRFYKEHGKRFGLVYSVKRI